MAGTSYRLGRPAFLIGVEIIICIHLNQHKYFHAVLPYVTHVLCEWV